MNVWIPSLQFSPALHDSYNIDDGTNGAEIYLNAYWKSSQSSEFVAIPSALGILKREKGKIKIKCGDASYVGSHQIKVEYLGQDYVAGQAFEIVFNLEISPEPSDFVFTVPVKPTFDLSSIDSLSHQVLVGQKWYFELPDGIPSTEEATVVYDDVDLGQASRFMEYSEEDLTISIAAGITESDDAGTYSIGLQLLDSTGTTSDKLYITLQIITEEETSEDTADSQSSSNYNADGQYDAIGLKFGALLIEREALRLKLQEQSSSNVNPPEAKIESIDSVGYVSISFTNKMVVLDELSELITNAQTKASQERRLEDETPEDIF